MPSVATFMIRLSRSHPVGQRGGAPIYGGRTHKETEQRTGRQYGLDNQLARADTPDLHGVRGRDVILRLARAPFNSHFLTAYWNICVAPDAVVSLRKFRRVAIQREGSG